MNGCCEFVTSELPCKPNFARESFVAQLKWRVRLLCQKRLPERIDDRLTKAHALGL